MTPRALLLLPLLLSVCAAQAQRPPQQLDAEIRRLMDAAHVPGLALALIEDGQVSYRQAYGYANVDKRQPLRTDTIMYGASLTKAAFAYMVMQLVDEKLLSLDATLPALLRKPLPDYPAYADLKDDPRWKLLTPRMLLSHTSGLLNWRYINDDQKLDFKYAPGSRYVYSGEGLNLLQLVIEERTGTPLQTLMQQRIFDRFQMRDSSMVWRKEWEGREATHYAQDGTAIAHKRRGNARAAGSMDTTLDDYASFLAGVLRGEGLSAAAHQEMLSPQLAIVSPQQFPSHWPGETDLWRKIGLSIGLGWPLYRSPLGLAFFKEGNDDGTNNVALGFLQLRKGIVMLSNSSNAEHMFYPVIDYVYGNTCLPWFWMNYIPYDRPELMGVQARDQVQLPAGCGS
ncbi:serine hydrolase domain-containing protein [Duganella callida]|uniref:Class A beta-lactamase-related serine hydrolase n=1 Tax=Duganella callida TaxID=2561932 RepID=A0A4Y9SZF3_9BURK|nr:serine hydrolase domain-containing protein [Duganella callida]TFW30941.1 class A beta-lactamase-related serine hydrolase [Duganella callida]